MKMTTTPMKMKTITLSLLIMASSTYADTAINSVPYAITVSGHYYLARDIIDNANAKITISASNVVLDLQGHTLQTSSIDEVILIEPFTNSPAPRTIFDGPFSGGFVTIQNGTIINKVASCIYLSGHFNTITHVTAVANAHCAIFDEGGSGNHITNCTVVGGSVLTGPGSHGPSYDTIELLGCSDLVENNMIGAALGAAGYPNGGGGGGAIRRWRIQPSANIMGSFLILTSCPAGTMNGKARCKPE